MSLVRQPLDLPPDPLELARRVARRPGAVLLQQGPRRAIVACDPVESVEAVDPEPRLALDPEAEPAAGAPRWIGLLPYEAWRACERAGRVAPERRPAPSSVVPRWQRYAASALITPRGVELVGDDAGAVRDLGRRLAGSGAGRPIDVRLAEPLEEPELHRRRIERALELIRAGELYQVNLARRFVVNVKGRAVDLLSALQPSAAAPHAAALSFGELAIVSVSPELLLSLDTSGQIRTAPIKGTRPRAGDASSDAELARELEEDPKERAELAMVIDVERNDLGRVAVPGSVELLEPPHVRALPAVHHRLAVVGARLRPGLGRTALFEAMLPSGSVTGAPKIRAMELIAELEPHRRGLYTGGYGSIGFDGGVHLAMAIRTLVVHEGRGVWFSGGGIVADSVPDREISETLWKARPLLELAGAPARLESMMSHSSAVR